jgi:TatD DNase family protein
MYIDIHTHKNSGEGTFCIKNIFPDDVDEASISQAGYLSCGIHPWYIGNSSEIDKQLARMNKIICSRNLLAIGEAGLDKAIDRDIKIQEDVFVSQMQLSEKFSKPMIIHCVKAYTDILRIKKKQKADMPWIIHGFNSSIEMADQLINNNCMLSFGKILFDSRSKASDVFRKLRSEKFFLETDDHDFTIVEIYQKAAEIRNLSIGNLKSIQQQNFEKVFGFNPVH